MQRVCECGGIQLWVPRGDRMAWVCRSCGKVDHAWGDSSRSPVLISVLSLASERIQAGTLPREAAALIREAVVLHKEGRRLMARSIAGCHQVSKKIWETAEQAAGMVAMK